MAWPIPDPTYPTSGTVITRAYAIANLIDPINWLRALTGNADPPAAGHVARSTSSTVTAWYDLDAALAARVARANAAASVSMAAAGGGLSGLYDVSSAAADAPVSSDWLLLQNRHTNQAVDYRFQLAAQLYDQNEMYVRMVISGVAGTWRKLWHAGNDGPGSGLDADTLDGVQLTGLQTVPLGAVVWFRTAAEVTAAGASWAVETNLAGRFPIGAGTTFSQTFVEATSYGANWTPLTGAVIAASTETPFLVSPGGGGGSTNLNTAGHTHLVPTTTWLPPMRAGVFARRI